MKSYRNIQNIQVLAKGMLNLGDQIDVILGFVPNKNITFPNLML